MIGGRLIERLLEDRSIRVRATSRRARIWPDGVEGCVVDLNDASTIDKACDRADVVVNLASMSERACAADPLAAVNANVGGALAWSSAAVEAHVARFVQVSTFKVYGNAPSGRINEASPTVPRSDYAITHRAAEDYARRHPSAVVFRLANGFGAPATADAECWDIILNQFCLQAVGSRHITLRSSGRAWRNFVPMDDVIGALACASRDFPSGTYNLGARDSMTVWDGATLVAQVCRDTLGYEPTIERGTDAPGAPEPGRLEFDTTALERAGYRAKGDRTAEIRRTLLAARAQLVSHAS